MCYVAQEPMHYVAQEPVHYVAQEPVVLSILGLISHLGR